MRYLLASAALAGLAATGAAAQDSGEAAGDGVMTARAALQDRDGNEVGNAGLRETPSGSTWVVVQATGMPAGIHGVHVHETGDCSAGDFTSAGGHLAGGAEHGILVEGGPHPGDLPNAHVQDDGILALEAFNDRLTADMVFDDDGAAVVVHAGADDYVSQPSGDSGDRIACGVIERVEE